MHVRMVAVAAHGRGRTLRSCGDTGSTWRRCHRTPSTSRQNLDVRAAAVPEVGEIPVPEQSVQTGLCAGRNLNECARLWQAIWPKMPIVNTGAAWEFGEVSKGRVLGEVREHEADTRAVALAVVHMPIAHP